MSTEVAVLVGLLCGSWLTIMVEVTLAGALAIRQSNQKKAQQATQAVRIEQK